MTAPQHGEKKTHRLLIRGRVQGVFFRDSMRREAQRLGVAGWVRNRNDGRVEAVVQGDANAVDSIIRWAWRGPDQAMVEGVDIAAAEEGDYIGFEILYR